MVSGGVERVTLNLIGQFALDGIECRLALRHCRGELMDEARALVRIDKLAPIGMHQFVPRLIRVIKDYRPTHVVTAFADVAALTWAALRLARSQARWVHGVHNTYAAVAAHPGGLGAVRHRIDNAFAGFVYRHADAIVAVSDGVRSEVMNRFGIDSARVTTIHNPVIPDSELRAMPEPRHPPDQPFQITAIGRLAHQKGFDVLVRAMQHVSLPWRLDIWGEGPERESLEKLIARLGLDASVHLRGYTHRPLAVLRQADLFVLSSRHEGLPTTLIEALACQCQIVATDCPHGPCEILQNGRLGRLVPPENVIALAEAIQAMFDVTRKVSGSDLLNRAADFSYKFTVRRWRDVLTGTTCVKSVAAIPG